MLTQVCCTARALGQTMSTLVVQEHHLWLTLADMRESDKHRFLDSPISQAGLFGEAVEDFAQQFSAAQKQTEAFRHILPRRSAAVSTPPPAAAPPPARRRRRPPAASTSAPARPQQQPSQWPQHGAGRRKAARPASAPAKPVKCQGRRRPWDGRPGASGSCSSGDGDSTTPSPGGGPGGEFLFCSATGPRGGTQNFIRAVSFFSGSQDSAFRVGPLGSTALPHRGYVYVSPGPACTAPGGLARAPQAVSLAPEDHQTRLRDSVRPASSQVQGQSVHLSVEPGCPCLACRSRGPTGEGRDTASPSSRDGVRALQRPLLHRSQETRWVTSNLGPACSEPGPCQAPVQDIDAETPLSMRPSLRLGCSDRPERRLLPCLDPPSIPLCIRRASIPVGPPLRAPQPVGASGQPGKEQTLPYAEDLFSRQGVGLGQPHSTSLRGACSVNAEMPGVSPAQEGGSTETFSEAPGAYGILSRYHAARIASYETASALASRPSPEMGMAPRHIPGLTHPVLPSHLQPMVGSCLSSGRSSPRASIQARCCFNRRLCHGLGGHVQRARSRGALDRAPAAVAYQLPRVAGSIACSAPLQNAATREAYTGPFGQHCDRCVHQPPGRSTFPSQLARHLLLWSQKHLRSLRAVHVPGELNRAADELSRQHALPGEWRLHPEVPQLNWRRFGDAQVDLFASPDTSHCQLFFSLSEGTLGTDALACSWPRGLRKYAFPPVSLLAQTLCKVREDEEQVLLVASYWPNRTWFPELMLLATAPPWQIPLRRDLLSQRGGTLWHPRPDLWNLHVWSLDGTRRF